MGIKSHTLTKNDLRIATGFTAKSLERSELVTAESDNKVNCLQISLNRMLNIHSLSVVCALFCCCFFVFNFNTARLNHGSGTYNPNGTRLETTSAGLAFSPDEKKNISPCFSKLVTSIQL